MTNPESNNAPAVEEKATEWQKIVDVPFRSIEGSLLEEEGSEAQQTKRLEELKKRAGLYRKMGKVALSLVAAGESDHTSNHVEEGEKSTNSPEMVGESFEDEQSDALVSQLESALGSVDKSLKNQLDYSIVNHKQINTREALMEELQSGTGIPELDIRFDKDGNPWISHSPRAGVRFLFSKPIHQMSTEEVAKYGKRLSLKEGLELFKQYYEDNPDHRVVLEIKELGDSDKSAEERLKNMRGLLEKTGLTEAVAFATLSPSILRSVHDFFPDSPKILNGGIAPIISHDLAARTNEEPSQKEFAVKIPGVELFFSDATDVSRRQGDGYGKQTGYLWARLPKETVNTLAQLNKDGKFGAASLAVVNMFANVLERVAPKAAEKMRKRYAKQLEQLNLTPQIRVAKKNSAENLLKVNKEIGRDTVAYADTSPGDWAEDLPDKSND